MLSFHAVLMTYPLMGLKLFSDFRLNFSRIFYEPFIVKMHFSGEINMHIWSTLGEGTYNLTF